MGSAADEATAVDDIGSPIEDGRQQLEILPRIVFQVGVLNEADGPACGRNSGPYGSSLASVLAVVEDANIGELTFGLRTEDLPCAVRRPIIDDQDLLWQVHSAHPLQDAQDRGAFVIDRHQYREHETWRKSGPGCRTRDSLQSRSAGRRRVHRLLKFAFTQRGQLGVIRTGDAEDTIHTKVHL